MTETIDIAQGITAVFVTMNRCAIADTCVARLAAQTLRPERVIVVNNASTDNTLEMLQAVSMHHGDWLKVVDLAHNLGNAGGMELALEQAFAADAQAVWVLDDDSWPEPAALASLLAVELPAAAVRTCRVVDPATGALSWPLQVPNGGDWRLLEGMAELPAGEVIQIRRSWLGALIPRQIYEAVGPVDGRFFLRGEDEDYPRRIESAGFPVFMVTGSLLHHPPSGPLHRWEFAGRTVVLESGLSADNLYYRLRNAWWMVRRDRGTAEALMVAVLHWLALWRWENSVRIWQPIWWEAAGDAFHDRLGARRRPRG